MTARTGTAPKTIDELYDAARSGHRRSLGRLLTKVERGGPDAEQISELAHPDAGAAHIIGITGAPGAGKSTLTGQLVGLLADAGRRPAVLAVDPSSPLTGGAILGDRIRMDVPASPGATSRDASQTTPPEIDERVFIRSMATRGHSGGLALAVPLAVRLFDAVGYDPVIIETVGVGQVEVDVVGAADTALVVMTPGMGDAVQANKAGLLEVADVFVVNKADRPGASDVRRDLELMLDLSHLTGQEAADGYRPPIIMSSALDGTGARDVLDAAEGHLHHLDEGDGRVTRRRQRVQTEIEARMIQDLSARAAAVLASAEGAAVVADAERGEVPPTRASAALLARIVRPDTG
ncbi:MAG: methylmalonyl Co-A mutase-associated GTPase MeaB [Actinomycetota bacterium]